MKKLSALWVVMIVVCTTGYAQNSTKDIIMKDLQPSNTNYNNINYNSQGQYGKADPKPPEKSSGFPTEYKVNNNVSIGQTPAPTPDPRNHTDKEIQQFKDNNPTGVGVKVIGQ
ncbi:MAG: hypothetical protein KDC07_08005 [Chitinophagaceae bacterium]|nr:hypothetical protein [Chitinophagaceae bacterium]MCB9046860.1 hypothetical protein [Chitinophagales bacterium]